MTVPTLMQNHQRKTYVVQLHKVYNELTQAAEMYMTDHNAVNMREAGINSQEALDEFVKSSFKVIQDCGATSTPCFAPNSEYRKISGVAAVGTQLKGYVTLASGVSLGYTYGLHETASYIATFDIDINGQKGPNIAGRDVFTFMLYNNGIIDDGNEETTATAPLSEDEREALFNERCMSSTTDQWSGCFGKLLNDNWEMNY